MRCQIVLASRNYQSELIGLKEPWILSDSSLPHSSTIQNWTASASLTHLSFHLSISTAFYRNSNISVYPMGTCWGNEGNQVLRRGKISSQASLPPHYLCKSGGRENFILGTQARESHWEFCLVTAQPSMENCLSAGLNFSPHFSIVMICSLRFLREITITYHYASHSVSSNKQGVSVETVFFFPFFFLSNDHVAIKKNISELILKFHIHT